MTTATGSSSALQNRFRTHYCGSLGLELKQEDVSLAGWVHRIRDHGGLIFIDLRDHTGICQLVIQPEQEELFRQASHLHAESVIAIRGAVVLRSPETVNPRLASGSIEVLVSALTVESNAHPLPFPVADELPTSEELRLKYRFIDLRREKIHENIIFRSRISAAIRRYLEERDFIEIQTPILTSSSPEGARDFLVPQPAPSRKILCTTPGSPAVQAATDGCGFPPLLPDSPMFPR